MKTNLNNIQCTVNASEGRNFTSQDKFYCFLIFYSPAILEVDDAVFDAPANSIFVRKPLHDLKITCKPSEALSYSFLTFGGSDSNKIFNLSGVEANVLLRPLQVHFTDSIFSKISNELSSCSLNWSRIVAAHILELLAKTFRLANHDFTETLPDHAQKLRDLRSEIHEHYSKLWKIDDMAKMIGLSTSRFASLYKATFKISPTEDLIQTRIDQAKKMLSSSKVSVKKVSEACGFESVHYFHRAFKKRANLTPKHFQNNQFAQEGSVYTPERHFSLDRLTQQAEYSGIIDLHEGDLKFHGNTHHVSELLGYSQSQLQNFPFTDFIAPEDQEIASDGVKKILQGKNILDLNIRLKHLSGKHVPVQFSALLKGKNWYWFIKHASVVLA